MNAINVVSTISRWAAALLLAVLLVLVPHAPGAMAAAPKLPDLTVSGLKVTKGAVFGHANVQFTVKNQGQADASNILVWVLVQTDKETAQIDKLAAGKSKQVVVDVPPILVRGNAVVMVTVQVDPNNTIAESNENNNEVTGPMRDPSTLPDLIVEKVDIQQTKVTPVEVKVTVRVKNQGKVDAPAYDVSVWEQETPGQPLQFGGLPGLKAGQSYDLNFNTQPAHTNPAKYVAEVDPQNKILEADENNNRGSGAKTLQIDAKLPDLVATIDKVELIDNKTRVALTWTVRNQGGSDALTKILVAIHQQQGLVQGGPELTNGLRKGQSYSETIYFSLPQNPADAFGTQLTVTVDSTNVVAESNEGNNVAVAYIPDPRPKNLGGVNPNLPVMAQP